MFPALAGRTEREDRIRQILRVCFKNDWTFDTPNMAGRLQRLLAPTGFTRETTRDYVNAIMDLLAIEKENRKRVSLRILPEPSISPNLSTSTNKVRSHAGKVSKSISQGTPYTKSRNNPPRPRKPTTSRNQGRRSMSESYVAQVFGRHLNSVRVLRAG